jgi:hypothetical protein
MPITLIVGGLLVIFGLLVLLKFPDRPGGKVALGKFEVSSTGAGLPLVALGVLCLLFGTRGASEGFWPFNGGATPIPTVGPSPTPSAGATPGARVDCAPDAGGEAVRNAATGDVEVGASEVRVRPRAGSPQPAFRLRLSDDGRFAGLVALTLHSAESSKPFFKVRAVFDRDCREVSDYENATQPGADPSVIQNWHALRLRLNGATYEMRLGHSAGALEVNYFIKK